MKKTNKILTIICLIIFILSIGTTISKATGETFKATLSTTSQTLEKGQEFKVRISFSDISTQKGLSVIEGKIYYDQNILEYVAGKEEFFDRGEIPQFQEIETLLPYNDGGFGIILTYYDSNVKDVGLTFKVKESTTASTGIIKFGGIKGSNATDATIAATAPDVPLTLNISQPVAVQSVTLNKNSLDLNINSSETLTATIAPSNATNKNVTWKSSDSTVAEVVNGKVTGKKVGTATITVTTQDGSKTAQCTVNVKPISVQSVSLNKNVLELRENESELLTATILPTDATNKNITWTSSNTEVAEVANGKITAKKIGTATITVTTQDGSKSATCNVKVVPILVQTISLDKTAIVLKENESATLTPSIMPVNATNKEVTWTSSNNEIAEVTNGRIVAKKAGNAIITATTVDGGKTATCTIEVQVLTVPVQSISLSDKSVNIKIGESKTITGTVVPENATDKELIWTSSDTNIAEVTNGTIIGKNVGTAVITVTSKDGTIKSVCAVTVEKAADTQKDTASSKASTDSSKSDSESEQKIKQTTKKEDKKTASVKLPYTGANVILPVLIILFAIIATITYFKNKRFKGIK